MGRSPCCDKNGLKKGPWTPEEDTKLIQYIQTHGPGNWRSLPKNAGLQRCGKSCRLRWTNYLRPDIKRGRFSFEEEETIIQLHSVLGNKWSAIAAKLPGRTDNEIKNYWNTHIRKRLLRMGIDPVTHAPRLDFLDLSSLLNSSPQINLSNLIRLQTLLNPETLKLALNLVSSNNDQNPNALLQRLQENHQLFNPLHQLQNQTPTNFQSNHTFENNVINREIPTTNICTSLYPSVHQAQSVQGFNIGDFSVSPTNTATHQMFQKNLMADHNLPSANFNRVCDANNLSDNNSSSFQSLNSGFCSVLSTPLSSPPPLNSASTSMFVNGGIEDDGSFCSNLLRFEIPENIDLDDFM